MSYLFNKTIYLVSPSFGCSLTPYKERLTKAIINLKKLGFKIIKGKNIFNNLVPFASASKEIRAKEIMDAFNSDASLILSVAGGEIENEILPFIDFNYLKDNKKIFMGFSDDTNLAFSLATISNLKTVYGCTAANFYDISDLEQKTIDLLLGKINTVSGYDKYADIKDNKEYILERVPYVIKKKITSYNSFKSVSGILLGGCLDCLISLCGTKYDKVKSFTSNKKMIFFLESCDLNPLQVKRGLFQLKESGWFDFATAFVFGRMQDINESAKALNYSYKEAIISSIGELNLPILFDVDLGHIKPSLPFINNEEAKITYEKNNIIINYK